MKDNNLYSRTYCTILYPEDESQRDAITLLSNGTYPAAGILHDKDVEEDGTLKKPHYHFVIRYKNARSMKAVAEELKIAENYLQPCRDYKKSLRYLIHDGDPDKFPYPIEEVFGALKTALTSILNDKTEDEQALAVLSLLKDIERPIRVTEFISLCAEKGLYSVVRRGAYLYTQVVKEHNEDWSS